LLPVTRIPTGAIMAFPKTLPAGWLACDGALYTSSALPAGFTWEALLDLRIYLGTTLGDPAGSVRMPDYRGRVIIGAGQGATLTARNAGETGGAETHTLTVSEMPSHSHSIPLAGTGVWGDGSNYRPGGSQTNGQLGSQGGGVAHNNMQPFAVANVAIKV
jgi:microcystin-dependent protein